MTHCDTGDVILIKFPYTNLSTIKKRPALVVSSNWYNNIKCDIIVLPITSRFSKIPRRDEYVLSKRDIQSGGLLKPSVVKIGKIMTLEKGFVLRSLGQLYPDTLEKIMRRVRDVLA